MDLMSPSVPKLRLGVPVIVSRSMRPTCAPDSVRVNGMLPARANMRVLTALIDVVRVSLFTLNRASSAETDRALTNVWLTVRMSPNAPRLRIGEAESARDNVRPTCGAPLTSTIAETASLAVRPKLVKVKVLRDDMMLALAVLIRLA